ncbi:MAG: efflux RND transporter permease subunit [Gammaproteobacteria bacterium]|jgi:multidrug efflux pump|nr:efflux RND transporter permease subunit [Gammaproteobacteria bacterium]MBT6042903.1 efflux RND transporter permease subunit [Gammaproteobacteria bacterium]
MNALISAFINRPRPVILILALLIIAGITSYVSVPKEAEPDIDIPQMYVNIIHEGISPEDAERLLIRPMETELRSLEGLKELRATGSEGSAVIILEFDAGFDADQALTDVREKVDLARNELPGDSEEPFVQEINTSLFPVLVVMLHGDVPERSLVSIGRNLRDTLESIPGVLSADVGGDREELLEVIVDPVALESYNLNYADLISYVSRNNRLVAAGALDSGEGRFAVKVPGVIEDLQDLLTLPVKTDGMKTVTFEDVATVRRTFKDPTNFARLNGNPSIALEITKRSGSNILEVVDAVKATVLAEQQLWPENVQVTFTQDNSEQVRVMLNDLVNNVAIAVILVMIVILGALGLRSAGLVGLSIPGAFLSGILAIYLMGYSMNIVVLFSLIMAVGMLVDGAIVVVELAERNMKNGYSSRLAFTEAAKRMAWPITASTATTLAVFAPLLFWPGLIGQFMKYLPITLLFTLAASLFMALLFVPTVGALLKNKDCNPDFSGETMIKEVDVLQEARQNLNEIAGFTASYIGFIRKVLVRPVLVLGIAFSFLIGTFILYDALGKGVEFFPDIEPDLAVLNIHTRGDLSVYERDDLVREVENRILDMEEFESVYARSGVRLGNDIDEDIIGRIQLSLIDWEFRRPAAEIMDEVRARTADLPGVIVEPQVQESGPTSGKPIQLELSANNTALLPQAVEKLLSGMTDLGEFIDVTDSRPLPGIDWRMEVDRQEAARFGTDISSIGSAIQLITNGIMLGDFRPDDADDEVDIRVRFPETMRNISMLDRLTVNSFNGNVPVSNFMSRVAAPRVGSIQRTDGVRVLNIAADVPEDVLTDDKVQQLQQWLGEGQLDSSVNVTFKGEDQDQREAEEFLSKAFGAALFLMAIILVTQFNSFYQALLILSAVMFSTIGVLLALLITDQPFGIVMSGIGVIALAGIVVNNNIVLIDTYNLLRKSGAEAIEAAMLTCSQRLRPVVLTTVTTILGLMPMTLGMNFDLINRHIQFGGPTTQWWTQLATAISGGLAFATVLTLVMTPCMLVLGDRIAKRARTITA